MTSPTDEPLDLPDDSRLMEAVQDYLAQLESGRRPNRSEYVRKYADVAQSLVACLEGLELVYGSANKASVSGATTAHDLDVAGLALAGPLGDFLIEREIGRGGMGVVYEARQVSLGRRVALKVLPLAAALDSRQLQRFKNEAQAAAHLHHPNIVPVYAIGCERGLHYYAMQLIEGQSLAEWIDGMRELEDEKQKSEMRGQNTELFGGNSPPPGPTKRAESSNNTAVISAFAAFSTEHAEDAQSFFRKVAGFGIKVAEALEYAHEVGVVHRDIKPGNLLLDQQGTIWRSEE